MSSHLAETLPTAAERPGFVRGTTVVRREPVGVVGAIAPWNFPRELAAPSGT